MERQPPPWKGYAFLAVGWRGTAPWIAQVIGDEFGIRVVHVHMGACAGACDLRDAPVPDVTTAIDLAKRAQARVIASRGRPERVDLLIEPTGDVERLFAALGSRPGLPRWRLWLAAFFGIVAGHVLLTFSRSPHLGFRRAGLVSIAVAAILALLSPLVLRRKHDRMIDGAATRR